MISRARSAVRRSSRPVHRAAAAPASTISSTSGASRVASAAATRATTRAATVDRPGAISHVARSSQGTASCAGTSMSAAAESNGGTPARRTAAALVRAPRPEPARGAPDQHGRADRRDEHQLAPHCCQRVVPVECAGEGGVDGDVQGTETVGGEGRGVRLRSGGREEEALCGEEPLLGPQDLLRGTGAHQGDHGDRGERPGQGRPHGRTPRPARAVPGPWPGPVGPREAGSDGGPPVERRRVRTRVRHGYRHAAAAPGQAGCSRSRGRLPARHLRDEPRPAGSISTAGPWAGPSDPRDVGRQ